MTTSDPDIATTLESILRGAAKILGCSSASLIVMDETTEEARLRVGVLGEGEPELGQVEEIIGSLKAAVVPFRDIADSLIFRSWRDREVAETGSMGELVGTWMPRDTLQTVSALAGERRFISVPAISGRRCYGLILFEKVGTRPFSAQQREILLRYAARIADIIENELRGVRLSTAGATGHPDEFLLVDSRGALVGTTPGMAGLPPTVPRRIALAWKEGRNTLDFPMDGHGVTCQLTPVDVRGEKLVLAAIFGAHSGNSPGADPLLHMALGDAAPAVLVDPDFRISSCNEATDRLFGYPAGTLIGQPVSVLFRDPQEARKLLNEQFLFLADGVFEHESALLHRDGHSFPGRATTLLLADSAGQVKGFLLLIRVRSGENPEETPERLMWRERLASMGELAGQLAHEVRNPLLAIGATLEAAIRDVAEGRDVRDTLDMLRSEVDRLDMILKDYLSLAARRKAVVSRVDLAEVADASRRLIESARRGARGRVSVRIPAGIEVLGEFDGLRHVFFNLMSNSLDAMQGEGRVTVSAEMRGATVLVHVDDTGPGLSCSPDDCFAPFFTTKKSGTGLGLTVCRKIVEGHGGGVTLQDRAEGGCRATVTLPLHGREEV